jgi:hypothetical protein
MEAVVLVVLIILQLILLGLLVLMIRLDEVYAMRMSWLNLGRSFLDIGQLEIANTVLEYLDRKELDLGQLLIRPWISLKEVDDNFYEYIKNEIQTLNKAGQDKRDSSKPVQSERDGRRKISNPKERDTGRGISSTSHTTAKTSRE